MIGQTNLLNEINNMANLPRFIIITGQKGHGKKTLARWIAKKFNYPFAPVGTKIDDIRYAIETAYKQTSPIIYLIADADDMSLGAKNSLLKVIEEPPQQAYFIMTLEQIENTLPTIKSRCQELKMQPYTYSERMEMIQQILGGEGDIAYPNDVQILNKLENYWQIRKVVDYGTIDFYLFVRQVYDHIYTVQGANAFKAGEHLDLKNDGNGYDLDLFFTIYQYCGVEDLLDDRLVEKYDTIERCLNITSQYRQMLSTKSANKQMLFDMWVLDIRREWLTLLG